MSTNAEEELLFSDSASASQAESPVEDGWEPVGEDQGSWEPQVIGDLESFLEEPTAGFGEQLTHAVPDAEPEFRNLIPSDTDTSSTGDHRVPESQPDYAAAPGPEPLPRGGPRQREALPSHRDAPVHTFMTVARPTAWVLPLLILVLGCGAGVVLYVSEADQILGASATALSIVGALFVHLLLKG